jgi:cation:H+ antiporter
MILQLSLIVLGLVVLTFGADFLVRGAGSVALRFGVTPLVVGLTVVAFGTSAPELVVSLKAAYVGQGDIAAGNVIGSNIFNIAVILGIAAMISPMRVQLQLLKFDAPIMLLTAGLLVGVFRDRQVERWEALILFAGIIAYVAFNVIASRKQHTAAIDAEFEEGVPHRTKSPWVDALLILGGLAMLVGGSRLLVDNAVALARGLGVSEAIIGLTIIAAGTSMPELATSVVAAIKKEADIAIGNIVGSNIFNVLAIVGISGSFIPFSAPGIAAIDLWIMLGISFVLVPLLVTGNRLARWEGAVLFASFIGYTILKWPK